MGTTEITYLAIRKFNLILALLTGIIVLLIGLFYVAIYSNNSGWILTISGAISSLIFLEIWQNAHKIKAIKKNNKITGFKK